VGFLRNTEDAKDALQEAAMSAYLSYDRLRDKKYFKTWMTRIVINKCKDLVRKSRPSVELTDELEVFSSTDHSDFEMLDAISRLGKEKAVYITLRFYNDLSYADVSRVLRLPVSTVKYRTAKALEELKRSLEGDVSI